MPQNGGAPDKPELIFAMTGPLGTRLDTLSRQLASTLEGFGYQPIPIRLSELLTQFPDWKEPPGGTEDNRVEHLQSVANALRTRTKDGAMVTRAGIAAIRKKRAEKSGGVDVPASGCAYIIYQLKHPDEVTLLRRVYGNAFYLIAGHAAREVRVEEMARRTASSADLPGQDYKFKGRANELIEIDQKADSEFGQNMRDTFPRADVFVDLNVSGGELDIIRFVDLLFCHPFHTPTPEEYCMYQASAVALRSSDSNRQVGAAIADIKCDDAGTVRNADILTVGMNEVSRGGGGFYWDKASPDSRDQALPEDRAYQIKTSALAELLERIAGQSWLGQGVGNADHRELARRLLPHLKGTQFLDIGEFSRPVHAEMAAIIDAARRGISIDGHSMFVTTFPCHNCTKHIVAAGLKRVIYLEPYPKSRVHLYREELVPDSADGKEQEGKVVFSVYSGIAPRQYRTLFSMSERGGKGGLPRDEWMQKKKELMPKYVSSNLFHAYVAAERREILTLPSFGLASGA
jgi:cytidine deaminase